MYIDLKSVQFDTALYTTYMHAQEALVSPQTVGGAALIIFLPSQAQCCISAVAIVEIWREYIVSFVVSPL